ncbi:hypothetical protein [Tropicimonas sp. IMCC34043]|uniref:hypothetical protein n=1 Tax=Tropicimonas sp. IMCC34043 TaxID=2248760 RepID=UPI000E239EC3|nr:hypothetical protein [Tropicimonas sp. IMCC34043]
MTENDTGPNYGRRLDRIEGKIDDLSSAVVSLARVEERLVTLFNRMAKVDEVLTATAGRLATLETTSAKRGVGLGAVERLFWIAVAALVAAVVRFGADR